MIGYEIKTVKTAGFEMDCTVFGSGEKSFVIIPGISLEPVSLSAGAIAEAYGGFAEDFTVYMFDRVKSIPDEYSVEEMARDTAQAMRTLGIREAYAFGASQGGMILECLAARAPELIRCGVLGSTSFRSEPAGNAILADWIKMARCGDRVGLNTSVSRVLYTPEYRKRYEEIFASLSERGTAEQLRAFAVQCEACARFDFSGELGSIRCPMLVLGAENDVVFPGREVCSELAKRLGCEAYVYPGYCHAVYDEAPDYKDRIRDFFNKCK